MSDIEIVPTPEQRKEAERIYSVEAFDFVNNPIGSRDWCLFWHGYQAALAASDERKDAERYRKLVGAMRVTEWTGAGYTYSVFLPAKRTDSDVGLILDAAIAAGKAGEVKP
jgi:hypothetical protein